ncbi:MAG: hypothetical protein AUK03_13600 [Anaerolineae bacterium CG2_30_64_16]|nr:MAG: hypothetical protein AUK03_13600 [Anaerolineae bacterium CG2_30_64_16]
MATIIINLTEVNYTWFDKPVLRELSWEIQAGQKIGLVGANGSGKSTLLKLILGRLTSEGGTVFRLKDLSIGYLPQDPEVDRAQTVLEAALSGSPEIARLRNELAGREAQMGDPAIYGDPDRLARVLDAHERLLRAYETAGGLTCEHRVRSTLRDLGLGDETFDQPLGTLSGGQVKLVGLARLLVWAPDLLLLDEPDNHLDVVGKQMIERLIDVYPGTVIIVSHDRYLLDQVVDRIAELDRGQIIIWPGTYSEYAVNQQLAALRQEQLYRAQQKRIAQIEAAIKRFELWASLVVDERHARQARARHKMLERMERVERPAELQRMRLELGGWRGSNKVLEISRLGKWFEDAAAGDFNIVLDGVDLTIWHGERVGLVGPNGAGKSVLFRCILAAASTQAPSSPSKPAGESAPPEPVLSEARPEPRRRARPEPRRRARPEPRRRARPEQRRRAEGLGVGGLLEGQPDGGTVRLGPSVSVGYYAQQHETLHPDWTVVQEIRDVRPMYEADAYAFLNRFLFDYDAAQKQVRQLSGGERSRLQLARLMRSDANFLLLDEPTNNLDIPSAEVLEAALEEFNGTVLVISHDRYFLDRIVDRVVALEDGALVETEGGYSDYLAGQAAGGKPTL